MASKTTRSSGSGTKKSSTSSKSRTKTAASKKKTSGSTRSRSTSTRSRSASGRSTSSKKASTSRKTSSKAARQPVNDEVILIIVLAVSALMLLGIFGLGGRMGDLIARFLFGLFGQITYIIPFILFIGIAFHLSNRHNRLANLKITAFIILLIAVMTIITVVSQETIPVGSLKDAYVVSASTHKGGGLIGALIGLPLYTYFGRIASILIMVCIILVTGVLVTGKRFFMNLGTLSAQAVDWIRDKWQDFSDRRAERRLERAQEEELRRIEEEQEMQRMQEEDSAIVVTDTSAEEEPAVIPEKEKEPAVIPPAAESTPSSTGRRFSKRKEETREENTEETPKKPSFLQGLDEKTNTIEYKPPQEGKTVKVPSAQIIVPEFLKGGKFTHGSDSPVSHTPEQAVDSVSEIEEALDKHFADVLEQPEMKEQKSPLQEIAVQEDSSANLPQPSEEPVYEETELPREEPDPEETGAEPANRQETTVRSRKSNAGKIVISQEEAVAAEKEINDEIARQKVIKYEFPPLELLDKGSGSGKTDINTLKETAMKLQSTFDSFGVGVTVTDATRGPSVTRYEVTPDTGVKVSRIVALENDLKLNLAVTEIRIEAPIPGKAAVGIEVPNTEKEMVRLRDLLGSDKAATVKSKIGFAVGKDIAGQCIFGDIEKMPHLLIAGATGSGKSVCINTLVMSILYRADPAEVKMIMIDPKVVELSVYNGIPHLLVPVVTDPKKAAAALNWAVANMMERYKEFSKYGVRNIKEFNKRLPSINASLQEEEKIGRMPQIVIIIDELADLMMVAQAEVENSIQRLSQLARAAGIHLVIATQRPSVNVITGTIKANIPSRIAFSVSSGVDSRTILDMVGAEKLLGNGDMLFMPQGISKPVRIQGAFVSDEEIARVTSYIKGQYSEPVSYDDQITSDIEESVKSIGKNSVPAAEGQDEQDVYFEEAGRLFIEKDKATIGMLQRALRIGFNRASRLMDQLSDYGVVGPETGTKPRKILMTMEEFEELLKNM